MRIVPQSMQGGAMTLSRCWRIFRRDEKIIAFTDHDRDLTYDDILHRAIQGIETSAHESGLGFSTAGSDASGVLMAPGLVETDIVNGLYDGSRVEIDLVDWLNIEARLRLEVGVIGEITRSGYGFTAEIRSLTTQLDEERGRLFRPTCSAELGDKFCKVKLDDPQYTKDSYVQATDGRRLVSVLNFDGSQLFDGGLIKFISGRNAGDQIEIRFRQVQSTNCTFLLWQPSRETILVNDQVQLIAGCDKNFSTCRDVYGNIKNFRGFPHLPGNDFVISYVADGAAGMNGGSLFK